MSEHTLVLADKSILDDSADNLIDVYQDEMEKTLVLLAYGTDKTEPDETIELQLGSDDAEIQSIKTIEPVPTKPAQPKKAIISGTGISVFQFDSLDDPYSNDSDDLFDSHDSPIKSHFQKPIVVTKPKVTHQQEPIDNYMSLSSAVSYLFKGSTADHAITTKNANREGPPVFSSPNAHLLAEENSISQRKTHTDSEKKQKFRELCYSFHGQSRNKSNLKKQIKSSNNKKHSLRNLLTVNLVSKGTEKGGNGVSLS